MKANYIQNNGRVGVGVGVGNKVEHAQPVKYRIVGIGRWGGRQAGKAWGWGTAAGGEQHAPA